MPQKKKTTPKKGSAETQTDHSARSETPKISPPRGFTPKDDKKLQDLTSDVQESTDQFPAQAIKEVLNVLKVVERQFDKLRDEQQKQEAVYDELIQKIQAIEKAELKLSDDRKKLSAERKKVAETDKIALEMIEESQQTLQQQQNQFQSERQSSAKELAKLRSELEQESKSLHAERDSLIRNAEKAEQQVVKHAQKIKKLNSDHKELVDRIEQLQNEAQQARHQASETSRETQELRSQAERQRDESESRSQDLGLRLSKTTDQVETLQNRIEALQNKSSGEETQTYSSHDRISQLEADLADRERVISSLQKEAKSVSKQKMTAQPAADESKMQLLRDRVAELESELAAAREASVGLMNEPNDTPGANFEKIKANLQEVAIHLHRRQERLQRARQLVRESKNTSAQAEPLASPAQTREEEANLKRWVQNQRQRLAHEQTRLKEMESRMIKIWAPRNAAAVVSALGLLLAIMVAASWLTTSYVFPAHISASVTLKPKTLNLDPLTDEQTADWQLWHAELVTDDEFKKTLLKRMRDRQMPVEDIDLDERLQDSLSLDTGKPSELTMTLSGTRKKEITDLLDVITSTVLIESNRQLKKRTGGAFASASNERKDSGISRYAVINPTVIQDHRKYWMAPIFLLYGILAFGVFKFALSQLKQVKRVINEEVVDTNESDVFNDSVQTPY